MSSEENKTLMLEATDAGTGEKMGFAPDHLEEAKEWLWVRYKKCKSSCKNYLQQWKITAIEAGQWTSIEYTLDPEDFYTDEQVDFVNWLIREEYVEEERELCLLEQLADSVYRIKFEEEEELTHKKLKKAEEEKEAN